MHAISRVPGVQARLVHLIPSRDLQGPRTIDHDGITVHRIPFDPQNPVSWLGVRTPLQRALAGSDVVHSMAISSLIALGISGVQVPWVHTEHWSALTTPESVSSSLLRASIPIFRRLEKLPDVVTAVCEFLARPLREERGNNRVEIVPCVVEPISLAPRRDRSDGVLRLFATGSLIPRKDPLVAVETLKLLVEDGLDAHLDWLGDGPLRNETLSLAKQLGVRERVTLHGFVSPDRVMSLINQEADLFFGPTRADNFFVGAAEAILSGCPVVLGSTGGQGEYVSPTVGELVSVQDPTAYAEAIKSVIERTEGMTSEQIAATIGERFSSERVGAEYADIYKSLL
ncbi:glycosyltransferase family 4 protein [Dermabacteraceae bacterium P7006]